MLSQSLYDQPAGPMRIMRSPAFDDGRRDLISLPCGEYIQFCSEGESLTDVQRIISDLERQRNAIDRAIAALREITPSAAPAKRAAGPPAPAKRQMSPEGRQRIVDALKKRWAAKRAAESGSAAKKARPKKSAGKKAAAKRKAGGKQPSPAMA